MSVKKNKRWVLQGIQILRNSTIENEVSTHLYSSVSFWGANFSEAGGKTMRP